MSYTYTYNVPTIYYNTILVLNVQARVRLLRCPDKSMYVGIRMSNHNKLPCKNVYECAHVSVDTRQFQKSVNRGVSTRCFLPAKQTVVLLWGVVVACHMVPFESTGNIMFRSCIKIATWSCIEVVTLVGATDIKG